MIALGVIAAVWLLGKQLEDARLGTRDDASSIAGWGVVAGVIGARAYHVVTDWERFSGDLTSIPRIWEGGLGIPGGLLAGVCVGVWQAQRRGIKPAVALTFAAPAIALAQSIGRWGKLVQTRSSTGALRNCPGASRLTTRRDIRRACCSIQYSSTSRFGTSHCAGCCCGRNDDSSSPLVGCSASTWSATGSVVSGSRVYGSTAPTALEGCG